MAWTEERVAVLKRMWTEGHSASQIAKSLGEVTRNAVIGKVHRLGLSGRSTPSRPVKRNKGTYGHNAVAKPAVPNVEPAVKRDLNNRGALTSKIAALVAVPTIESAEEAEAIALLERASRLEPLLGEDGNTATIITIQESMCKWPIGDPQDENFALCGRASKDGSPYCKEHSALAFQAPRDKHKRSA